MAIFWTYSLFILCTNMSIYVKNLNPIQLMSFFQYAVDLIVHIFPHLFFQKIKQGFLDIKLNMIKKPLIATLRISQ